MKRNLTLLLVVSAVALTAASCGDDGDTTPAAANNSGPNGKTDDANSGTSNSGTPTKEGPSACADMIENVSGVEEHGEGEELIKGLNDPIANLVLHAGDSCPLTYAAVMDKLREMDKDDRSCKTDNARSGIAAMVVSESAQIRNTPTDYRIVVTRTCNGRATHHLFFSLFGVRAGGGVPEAAEVMAFDPVSRSYNYYEVNGSQWEYFGNSKDLIAPGATARCAMCHTGGGPVMKELDTPWLHWEGHHDTPGARELVDANEDLGSKSSGSTMESLTKAGNREWNDERLKHLKELGSVKRLLRPLFCTVEVNLDNGADFASSNLNRIPIDFYVDPRWGLFSSVDMPFDTYTAALETAGQFVSLDGRTPLTDANGTVRDTLFDFTFIERSNGDTDFVDKLVRGTVIDDDFASDVLAIDFTRPIFSNVRCGLLEFVPDDAEPTPDAIRDGMIANLQNAEGDAAAAELLGHLQNKDDRNAHKTRVEGFMNMCKARDKAAHMSDVMQVVTLQRNMARELPVFEFPGTMPFAEIEPDPDTRFNPDTCELTTD